MKYLPIVGILLLTGCASTSGPASGTTATAVAQAEVALTAAEKAATLYVRLPQCVATNRPICSEASINNQIKAADNVAFNAVMAARAGGDSAKLAAANAAVAALVTLIPITITH